MQDREEAEEVGVEGTGTATPVYRDGYVNGYLPNIPATPSKPMYKDDRMSLSKEAFIEGHRHHRRWETKDGGSRHTYDTGAMKEERSGKGRYDLLSPLAVGRIAGVYERGASKYDDRNWEQGIPLSRLLDSALRHLFQYLEGRQDEDHLAQAAWNIMALLHTEEMVNRDRLPVSLNDLPEYAPSGEQDGWRLGDK